jgi:mannose-6-phosphate isomerase-like protein (cupin superfamily)
LIWPNGKAYKVRVMDTTRRTLLQILPALAASSAFAADAPTLTTFVKPFGELPVKKNGPNESREILHGVSHSGCHLEVHETTLGSGMEPHPPHRHENEELFLLVKGTIAVTIEGKRTVIDAGSAAFVHSGELHGVRNPGTEPAQYFVVEIGI